MKKPIDPNPVTSKSTNYSKIITSNTIWILIGKIISQAFNLLTLILVIRQLPVNIYGTFNLLIGITILINPLSISPIESVFYRYIPEIAHNKEFRKLQRMVLIGFILALLSFSCFFAIIYIFNTEVSSFFNIPMFSAYLAGFSVYLIVYLFRTLVKSVLSSLLLNREQSILVIFSTIIRSLLLFLMLDQLTIELLLGIETIAYGVFIIPGAILCMKHLKDGHKGEKEIINPISIYRKRILKYGMFSAANELGAGIIGKSSDYLIISAISNQLLVGLYAFALRIYDIIFKILPYEEFLSVIRPVYIRKFIASNPIEIEKTYNLLVKVMMPLCTLPFLYFLVFGKGLINYVFDPKYIDAYWTTCVVLISNINIALFFSLGLTVQLKERMDIALQSKIVVIFSIIGGIFAMKHFGIIGVAWVSLLGDFLKNLFMLIRIQHEVRIRYDLRALLKIIANYALLALLFIPLSPYITNLSMLIFFTITFLLVSVIIIIKLHAFNEEEIDTLDRLVSSSKQLQKVKTSVLFIYHLPNSLTNAKKVRKT